MDFIKQNRIMGWSIILLVLLNVLALGTLWWTHLGPPPSWTMNPMSAFNPGREGPDSRRGPGSGPDVADFIERELKLDAEQVQAFREVRSEFFEDSFQTLQSIHTLKQKMMRTVFSADSDPNQTETLAQEIGQLHARLEMIQATHFEKLKALCKPEQKERFVQLLDDISKMTRPEAPPGRRGGRGGPPQMRGGRRGPMGNGPGPGDQNGQPMNGF